jgi:hypothetical protein
VHGIKKKAILNILKANGYTNECEVIFLEAN